MALIKFFFVLLAVLSYFLSTMLFWPLLKLAPFQTKKLLNRTCSFYSTIILKVLRVRIDEDQNAGPKGALIVANHLGYLDVLAIASKQPCSFITSEDIRKTPFLGQICELAGCLFVDRSSRKNIGHEVSEIVSGLERGISVGLFPEATSTNGASVLRFKRSMFQAAVDSGAPVAPVTINYRTVDGAPISEGNRDVVCWYGDMTFFSHLWGLCKAREVVCEIKRHPLILSAGLNSGELRDLSYELIKGSFRSLEGDKLLFVQKHFGHGALGA